MKKHHYTNSLRILALTILVFCFNSCVSTQQHTATLYKNNVLKSEHLNQNRQIQAMSQELELLRAESGLWNQRFDLLSGKNQELSAKVAAMQSGTLQKEIQNKELAIKKLNQDIDNKERELEFAKKNIEIKEEGKMRVAKELDQLLTEKEIADQNLVAELRTLLSHFAGEGYTVKRQQGQVRISLSEALLFEGNSLFLNLRGQAVLRHLADLLQTKPELDILIQGHADNRIVVNDKLSDDWEVSLSRSLALTRSLTKTYGLPPERVIASGRGAHYPIASNQNPEGMTKNRRTEIILTPHLEDIYRFFESNQAVIRQEKLR